MDREEWTRSDQGKKTQRRRCGKTIETERSEGGLRSDPIYSRTPWAWLGTYRRVETPRWLQLVIAIIVRAKRFYTSVKKRSLKRQDSVGHYSNR